MHGGRGMVVSLQGTTSTPKRLREPRVFSAADALEFSYKALPEGFTKVVSLGATSCTSRGSQSLERLVLQTLLS